MEVDIIPVVLAGTGLVGIAGAFFAAAVLVKDIVDGNDTVDTLHTKHNNSTVAAAAAAVTVIPMNNSIS